MTLKDGWTFSNGEKVTAKSFVDAWNYGALLTNKQKNAPFFQYIEGFDEVHPESGTPKAETMSGLTVKDDKTFTVKLNQKFSSWPDTLGYSAFMPLPQTFYTDHDAWVKKPVGNGPYVVDSYVKGSALKMRKWEKYPGKDPAQNGGIDLRVYTDNNTAYTDLQAGNLDLVDDVPAAQLKNVKADLGDRYINQPAGIIQTLTFPMYDKNWNGPGKEKVRRGMSMAIDRAQITDEIFQKTRTPATDWTSPVLKDGRRLQGGPVRRRVRIQRGRGQEADQGRRRSSRREDDHQLQRRHRLAQGLGRRDLQQHQQFAGQRQRLRRRPRRHLRRLPQQDHGAADDRPVPGRLADGLPADPELPAAAVLHQRLLQRRQVQQRRIRQARQRGECRDGHR